MGRRELMCLVLCAACGRIGYDSTAEGGLDATATIDAPMIDAAPLGSFGPATIITPISHPTENDADPSLTADLLELYFVSQRPSGGLGDIWMSSRPTVSDPWSDAIEVVELNSSDKRRRFGDFRRRVDDPNLQQPTRRSRQP